MGHVEVTAREETGLSRRDMLVGLGAAAAGSALGGIAPAQADPGPQSGLPWSSGVYVRFPEDVPVFENFRRGRKIDTATVFMIRETWNDIEIAGQRSRWLSNTDPDRAACLIYSFGWLPTQPLGFSPFYEPTKTAYPARWNTLAAALGTGSSDDCEPHWVKAANSFTGVLKNAGYDKVIVRVGWEFTSKDYPWSAYQVRYAPAFRKMWARCATILKDNSNGVQVLTQWDPLRRGYVDASVNNWYPDDARTVDIIGVDYYEGEPIYKRQSDWDKQFYRNHLGGPWGLGAWLEYARGKGKKFGTAEWGVHKDSNGVIYVRNMFAAFQRYSSVMAYENLYEGFEGNAAASRKLSTSSRLGEARAEYLRLWGA